MVLFEGNRGRVLYADWGIQELCGVERFSDYRKAKARIRRAQRQGLDISGSRQAGRRFGLSDRGLTIIVATAGVVAALATVATLIVALL